MNSNLVLILAMLAGFVVVTYLGCRYVRWLRERGYAERLDALYNTIHATQERIHRSVGMALRAAPNRRQRGPSRRQPEQDDDQNSGSYNG